MPTHRSFGIMDTAMHCRFTHQITVIFAVLLSAFAIGLPRLAHADALDTAERAAELLAKGDTATARQLLAGVTGTDDQAALFQAATATAALQDGDVTAAEAAFRKALARNPDQLSALWGLSLCLLHRNCAFEASTLVDRAATLAPTDTRIRALQAYTFMLLGRTADAAAAGKAALESDERSPFLLATLAQIHRNLGYAHKALEFGSFAAKSFNGMNFLATGHQITLPLAMVIADTPKALANADAPGGSRVQRTDLEMDLPRPALAAAGKSSDMEIGAPKAGDAVHGVQEVRGVYHGTQEVKFVIFLADRVLRGMATEVPYHFTWNADAAVPGEHQLTLRAYDFRGAVICEDTITVVTDGGKPAPKQSSDERVRQIEEQMIGATMPAPAPLSLFTQLGYWHRDVGETSLAIVAFEKAAAIDPAADGVLPALAKLYNENGLHPLSGTGEVTRGTADGRKRVALTFDDGPNPLYTPTILSELRRYNAHATFFMVGKMVQQYPDLALQTLADGHELANHTYTHPNMTKLTQQEIIAEVLRTRAVIKEVTGRQTYLFRPPGGNIDAFVTQQLRSLDYNIIYWSINAGEFRKLTPAEQSAQIASKTQDGSILLLHNGPVDGTLSILPTLLADLNRRGFTFVTVSELMRE